MTAAFRPNHVLLAVLLVALGEGPSARLQGDESQKPKVVLPNKADVDRLLDQQEFIARQALDVLSDSSRSTVERLEAARLLGRLRYPPAIPVLLQYLEVLEAAIPANQGSVLDFGSAFVDFEARWPCIVALAEFGLEAMPAAVEAYLDPKASERRMVLLLFTFKNAGIRVEARRYVVGLRNECRGKARREKIDDLLNQLPH